MSWFFSSQIHWGEYLFFVASLEPHFHLHSLCLPNSPCLYVLASVWTFFLPGKKPGRFFHMTSSPFTSSRLFPGSAHPERCRVPTPLQSHGWRGRFRCFKTSRFFTVNRSPRETPLLELHPKCVFLYPWSYTFSVFERSEPTWKQIKSDKSSRSTLNPPGLHVARALRTTQWTDGDPKGGAIICGGFVFRSQLHWDEKMQMFTQLGVKLHERILHLRSRRYSKYWGTFHGTRNLLCYFSAPFETGLGMLTLCRPPFKNSRRHEIVKDFFGRKQKHFYFCYFCL